jgi:hypothetical protein
MATIAQGFQQKAERRNCGPAGVDFHQETPFVKESNAESL